MSTTSMPGLGRIFLCHSSDDKAAVRALYDRLVRDGFQPWLDEKDLLPGQDWAREIPIAVRESRIVLACLSRSATNKRGYVQREIRLALDAADELPEGEIYIIPVKLEACEVPARLARWQWVDLCNEEGYSRLVRALQSAARLETPGPSVSVRSFGGERLPVSTARAMAPHWRMLGNWKVIAIGLGSAAVLVVLVATRIDRTPIDTTGNGSSVATPNRPAERVEKATAPPTLDKGMPSGQQTPGKPAPMIANPGSTIKPAPPRDDIKSQPPYDARRDVTQAPPFRDRAPLVRVPEEVPAPETPKSQTEVTGPSIARVGQDMPFSIQHRAEVRVAVDLPPGLVAIENGRERPDVRAKQWTATPGFPPNFELASKMVLRAISPGRHCLDFIMTEGVATWRREACVTVVSE